MFLIPMLYHHVGLPLTILLVAAIVGLRVLAISRRRAGRAAPQNQRHGDRQW